MKPQNKCQMKSNILKNISENMMSRYSNRFKKLGRDVKTLGWGNVEQQEFRFQQTLEQRKNSGPKTIIF